MPDRGQRRRQLRSRGLIVAAVVAQAGGGLIGIAGFGDARKAYVSGLVVSAVCALWFCARNLRVPGVTLVSAGLVNTPKRALVMNFTKGYVPYTQILMVPVNGANSVAELNQAGKKITALTASTAFFRAQLLFPKATVTPLAQDQALLSVATGKADACLVEDYLAKPFIAQHSNVKLMNNGQAVATEFGCWGVPAGDYLWWRWLDNWISYNIDNAQLPGMYTNTFGLNWVHPS